MSKFVLFRSSKNWQYYFTLHAANGEPILQSEGYVAKQGALNGIAAVRRQSPFDHNYARLGSAPALWFVLKGANGEPLGRSETHTTSQAREVGINSVKVNAPTAPIDDRTLSAA